MRTQTKVKGRDSLVVHLNGVESHPKVAEMGEFLTHRVPAINKALSLKPDIGVPVGSLSRQMLRPGTNSHSITNDNSCKQRIATFYLAKMGSRKELFEHRKYFFFCIMPRYL